MVDIERTTYSSTCRFVIAPNQSITWRQLKIVFALMCVAPISVALGLAWLGFWPVLPFAGLELAALGTALYVVARRNQIREVIYIDDDSVRIERGREAAEQQWTLTRGWARVVLERCPKRWYPSRLLIRSRGHSIEVGRFLTEEERQQLARELSRDLRWA